MERFETPAPLATRIARLAKPAPRRVIFKLKSDTVLDCCR